MLFLLEYSWLLLPNVDYCGDVAEQISSDGSCYHAHYIYKDPPVGIKKFYFHALDSRTELNHCYFSNFIILSAAGKYTFSPAAHISSGVSHTNHAIYTFYRSSFDCNYYHHCPTSSISQLTGFDDFTQKPLLNRDVATSGTSVVSSSR